MFDSMGLAKIEAVILVAVIGLAATAGAVAYFVSNQKMIPAATPTPLFTPTFSPTPTISLAPSTASATAPTSTTFYTAETLAPTQSPTPTLTLAPTQQPTFSTTPTPTTRMTPTTQPTPTPTPQPKDPYRVGVCADLDTTGGTAMFRGATLAVEQINAAGGLLGRNLTVVAEDDDSVTSPYDVAVATNALNRLIAVDKADCVISTVGYANLGIVYQDICSTQRKIQFSVYDPVENLTQRVMDNYDKYKYSFRCEAYPNSTTLDIAHVQQLAALKNATGFTKVGYMLADAPATRGQTMPYFESELPKYGLQIVYRSLFPLKTMDFTSYLAQAEAANTQILFCISSGFRWAQL